MAKKNWIFDYYQKVKDGRIIAGEYIQLILHRLVEGIQKKEFFYDGRKANHAIDWIEAHTFHTEGPLAPGPFKLELWEKAFVAALFGIVDDKGQRYFREAVLIVARKNGKSTRPVIKPVSPALAGRFPTTGPPGKSCCMFVYF